MYLFHEFLKLKLDEDRRKYTPPSGTRIPLSPQEVNRLSGLQKKGPDWFPSDKREKLQIQFVLPKEEFRFPGDPPEEGSPDKRKRLRDVRPSYERPVADRSLKTPEDEAPPSFTLPPHQDPGPEDPKGAWLDKKGNYIPTQMDIKGIHRRPPLTKEVAAKIPKDQLKKEVEYHMFKVPLELKTRELKKSVEALKKEK